MELNKTQMFDLEELIDKTSLGDVLQALVDICYLKAEHLTSDWQDHRAARSWEKDASKMLKGLSGIEN